jgi:isopropylmalate/homocitrate/citramalate synthase
LSIEIVEVGPRDGLQNHPALVGTADKIALVRRAVAAGTRRVEVTSFVHPAKVPQLADAEQVMAGLGAGVDSIGVVMNDRGLDRAIAAGVTEVNVVVVASDTFSLRNQGVAMAGAIEVALRLIPRAHEHGLRVSVTVGAAFGCPFEGEIPLERVLRIVGELETVSPDEVSLADTIGVAVPAEVEEAFLAVRSATAAPLRCHFHNTRNLGTANVLAAAGAGVRSVDASVGGIGGCPFAPKATGNVATEDVVYALERSGYRTGVSLDAAVDNALWLGDVLGAQVPGLLSRAGAFA